MTIFLNGQPCLEQAGITLGQFIAARFESQSGIAVAVDYQIVPSSKWENVVLQDLQKITVIKASQGG